MASKICQANCPGCARISRAVLGIGIVAEVGTLVDEALALGVHHDAEGVAVLLKGVAHRQVAEVGGVALPADGVAAGPVAPGHGADLQGHADALSGVEAAAADLGQVPAGAEIAGSPFTIGLKAAAGEHHCGGADLDPAPGDASAHPLDAALVGQQPLGPGLVERKTTPCRAPAAPPGLQQTGAAAPGLNREAAPELEAAVHLESLAAPNRLEADALAAHPLEGRQAAGDQDLHQLRVGTVVGDPDHVVEEAGLVVAPEVGLGHLLIAQVRHQRAQRGDAVVGDPHGSGGETGVAAGPPPPARASSISTSAPASRAASAAL